jgi:predicted dienelactone hydrolase
MTSASYDPFLRGPFPVGVRTITLLDAKRSRTFSVELWYAASEQHAGQDLGPETQDSFDIPRSQSRTQMAVRDAVSRVGSCPLIVYSHPSGAHRRAATFLATHLASHGYLVAALDHSEVIAPELVRKQGESESEKLARWEAVIAARVPDVKFLLDQLLHGELGVEVTIDGDRVGIVGHSFGGWTALAVPESDMRVRAVVALAPAGSSNPKPGILPAKLTFRWHRNVATLYLVAENDTSLPLEGMYELFQRTPEPRQMVILRRADHMHFMDNAEELHEAVRNMPLPPDLAEMQCQMLPFCELCSGEEGELCVRALTLAHFDATIRDQPAAGAFLTGDVTGEMENCGLPVTVYRRK